MTESLPLIVSVSKDAGWSRKPYEALLESATFAHSSASPRLRVNEATAGQHRPLPRWPKFICNRPAHAVGEVRWGPRGQNGDASSCGETPALILPHRVGEETGSRSASESR